MYTVAMKKVNLPQSAFSDFAGMWVAIKDKRIVAVADDFDDIKSMVVGTKKHPPTATALRVPKGGMERVKKA